MWNNGIERAETARELLTMWKRTPAAHFMSEIQWRHSEQNRKKNDRRNDQKKFRSARHPMPALVTPIFLLDLTPLHLKVIFLGWLASNAFKPLLRQKPALAFRKSWVVLQDFFPPQFLLLIPRRSHIGFDRCPMLPVCYWINQESCQVL
jgi:hypothetical protein